jgi:hypothetical protein
MGVGDPAKWARPERLGHLINQCNKLFNAVARQWSQANWAQTNAQISAMIAQGVQRAAQNYAADETTRRNMLLPGPMRSP